MSDNKEPGILDILDSFFSGDESETKKPAFKCGICNNNETAIFVQCGCGWSINGCLPCSLASGHIMQTLTDHRNECEKLQRQIRISEAAQ